MKTPEEWDSLRKEIIQDFKEDQRAPLGSPYTHVDTFNRAVKAIQQDAYQAGRKDEFIKGLERASKICHNSIQSQSWYFRDLIKSEIKKLKK